MMQVRNMQPTTWSHPYGANMEKTVESTFSHIQKPFAEVQGAINEVQDQKQREAIVGLTISALLRTSRVSQEFLVTGLDTVQCEALVSFQQTLIELLPQETVTAPVSVGARR